MASSHASVPPRSRWLLLAVLLVGLLFLGVYNEHFIIWLIGAWQKLLGAVGLSQRAQLLQQGLDGAVAKRPLPAVATYAVIYLSLCLLILRLALRPAQWRLALRLYALGLGLYLLITLAGRLAGNAEWAYRLGRHLLDFMVSPLPMAGLYVLFRAGFGPTDGRDDTAAATPSNP